MSVRAMVNLKKAADELTAKAAFETAKGAAKRAIEDAMSSDEERALRKAEEAALAKKKRTKLVALGVVGLLLTLGVIGMVLAYWHWFLLLGLLGLVALYARHRWRQRGEAKHEERAEPGPAEKAEHAAVPRSMGARLPPPNPSPRVSEATRAEADQAIEDELAALKARVDK